MNLLSSFLGRFTRSYSPQSDGTSSFCQILLRGRIEFWLPNLCLLLGLYRDAVWSWGPAVFNNITAFLIFLTERRSQSTSNRCRQYLCFFFLVLIGKAMIYQSKHLFLKGVLNLISLIFIGLVSFRCFLVEKLDVIVQSFNVVLLGCCFCFRS